MIQVYAALASIWVQHDAAQFNGRNLGQLGPLRACVCACACAYACMCVVSVRVRVRVRVRVPACVRVPVCACACVPVYFRVYICS